MFRVVVLFFRHYVLVPLALVVVVTSLFFAGMLAPKVGWIWGMDGLDKKANLLAQAVYWTVKVKLTDSTPISPDQIVFCDIVGIDAASRISVLVPDKKKYVRRSYAIANIEVVDALAAKSLTKEHAGKPVKLRVYGDAVVIWDQDKMLNLALIEDGFARPHPNPPSPAYHAIFAEHLWTLLKE